MWMMNPLSGEKPAAQCSIKNRDVFDLEEGREGRGEVHISHIAKPKVSGRFAAGPPQTLVCDGGLDRYTGGTVWSARTL